MLVIPRLNMENTIYQMSLLDRITERSIYLILIGDKNKISVEMFVYKIPEDKIHISALYAICGISTNTKKMLDMLYSQFDKICIARNEEITWEDYSQTLLKMEAIRKEIDAYDLYWKT